METFGTNVLLADTQTSPDNWSCLNKSTVLQSFCYLRTEKHTHHENDLFRDRGFELCLCVRDTAIAVPDWALGGHLVMSACIRVSSECERLRLGDFTNAWITHRRDDVGSQLLPNIANRRFAFALERIPCPFGWGQRFELGDRLSF